MGATMRRRQPLVVPSSGLFCNVLFGMFLMFLWNRQQPRIIGKIRKTSAATTGVRHESATLSDNLQRRLELCGQQLEEKVQSLNFIDSLPPAATKGPQHQHQPSAAICAIQKGGLYYIDEWVDYHLALGFDRIYIYDNSDDFELKDWAHSKNPQSVHVQHWPGSKQQQPAYKHCVSKLQQRQTHHDWVAIFDIDEFIVLKKHSTIVEMLRALLPVAEGDNTAGGLALNRYNFYFFQQSQDGSDDCHSSSSIISSYEPTPVLKRFQYRLKTADTWIKTIAKTNHILRPNVHAHKYSIAGKNNGTIDTMGRPVTAVPSPLKPPTEEDEVAIIHHYQTKSLQEFRSKCQRGDAAYGIYDSSDAKKNSTIVGNQESCLPIPNIVERHCNITNDMGGTILDDTAWQFLYRTVPSYQKYG